MKKLIYFFAILFYFNVNAQTWTNLGSGTDDYSWTLTVYNNELYAGGAFSLAGGLPCNKMAKWNGTNWDTLPNVPGVDNISTLESFNGELYMGRGSPPPIYRWNNSNWSLVGAGLNQVPVDMIEFNGELYVGGLFTTAGGNPANHVAKWNGTAWSNVGSGFNKAVLSFAVYNGELYAAGIFDTAGAFNITHRIAKWNGANWVSLGTGITGGDVSAMAVYNGELYVGGDFTTAGGISVSNIARWNGTSWNSVASGVNGFGVGDLSVYNSELYAGGYFTIAGGISANSIAKWNGSIWSAVGTGTTGEVGALSVYNGDLYAAGFFTSMGGVTANNIAKWNNTTGINNDYRNNYFTIYPNPFITSATLELDNAFISDNPECKIYDVMGKIVSTYEIKSKKTTISRKNLSSGIYFYDVVSENKIISKGKLIIQ